MSSNWLSFLLTQLRTPDRQVPWLSSILVHVTLLALLSLVVFRSGSEAHPLVIETRLAGDTQFEFEMTLQELVSAEEPTTGGASTSAIFVDVAAQARTDPQPQAELARPFELSPFGALSAGSVAEVGESVAGVQGGRQAGAGGLSELGTGTGTGFFGSKVSGKRVVFVVDASRSMNMFHPGPARTRFKRVQLELIQAIAQMTSEQQFFVVFFNSSPWPMPADQPVNATPQAQQFYLRWVAAADAGGRTFPGPALALALKMQPDVIYFLTDGRFDPRIVPLAAQLNRGQAVIHTIGFADNGAEQLLTEIATQNGGRYRFIPSDEVVDEGSVDSADGPISRTASSDPAGPATDSGASQ